MNTFYQSITSVVFLFLLLTHTSCTDESKYAITAQVGTYNWKSDGYVLAHASDTSLLINAISNTYFPLVFYLKEKEVGTYTLNESRNQLLYGHSVNTGYVTKDHHPGELIITRFTKDKTPGHITGTFNGYVFNTNGDSLNVKEGTFDLYFD